MILINILVHSNGFYTKLVHPKCTVFNMKNNSQDMAENDGKFLIIFIIGVVVFSIGMVLPSLEVVLLGGLLTGIAGMVMLVSVVAKWK